MGVDKNIRILIAEDDEINRKLLTNILNALGYANITAVQDGKLALEKLRSESFDLVLTDWMMPEMDGLELLKNIRQASDSLKDIPVVMITALGKQENIIKASKWNINGYIVKPFSVNTVLEKMEEIMG